MQIHFLEARLPLAKTIGKNSTGELVKSNYPMVRDFTSHTHDVHSLMELCALMELHAKEGHCLLKGQLNRELNNESRKGSTQSTDATEWLCLDIDGSQLINDAEDFVQRCLPPEFEDVSYIEQVSASFGLVDSYSAHLIFLLDQPTAAPLLKEWLKHLNFQVPELKDDLTLNKDGTSIKYRLDITTCQNDKLIFIAPPVLENGLQHPERRRIQLVTKTRERVTLDTLTINAGSNDNHEQTIVNELRAQLFPGMPKKRAKYTWAGAVRILTNPDKMTLLGAPFSERGYTYLPLSDNRYTYWHPDDNPTFIRNFSGAPVVRTADALPDYWAQLQEQVGQGKRPRAFVFRDWKTDRYFNAVFENESLTMFPVGSKDKMSDFLAQYGLQLPTPIPDFQLEFEPNNPTQVDFKTRFINLFQPTIYMRNAKHLQAVKQVPRVVHKIIFSALGSDVEAYEHFLNWIAYIWQRRTKTRTAWVTQGIEGTGKGLIYHDILRPLFGMNHCNMMKLQDFDDAYAAWRQTCLILFIDEADISATNNARRTIGTIKNMITEPSGRVRAMRTDPYQAEFHENILFASNEIGSIPPSDTDRRLNVAPYQTEKLITNDAELAELRDSLQDFACYLEHFSVKDEAATTALINEAKALLRRDAMTSHDSFMAAIRDGDFEFFASSFYDRPLLRYIDGHMEYQNVVRTWAKRFRDVGYEGLSKISRDEMMRIYEYMQAGKQVTPNRFTSMLKHRNLHTTRMNFPDITGKPYGMYIQWQNGLETANDILQDNQTTNLIR